ncbi:MAG: hypothetical protein KIT87_18820 [Anaerolineae bacterium]|nr:hypothetical protein [Anaerolineae bacterium]
MKRLLSLVFGLTLALLAASASGVPAASAQGGVIGTLVKPPFVIRTYSGKCLDFGPPPNVSGSPVFIYTCNGTVAQQVSIEEVDARHNVILRAGTKVIGVKQSLVNRLAAPDAAAPDATADAAAPNVETPLELQDEKNRTTVFSLGQIFALDGDSIILAANRNLVVKVQNGRGTDRTPIVLGGRELADAEFWTFTPIDGLPWQPTTGFVRVPQDKDFVTAVNTATFGTVVQVDAGASLDLAPAADNIVIPEGVTIRGDRRGTRMGPELTMLGLRQGTMLAVGGNDVRITGLRLRGPSRSTDEDGPDSRGILVHDNQFVRINIDHNDLSDWTGHAIDVWGDDSLPDTCNVRDHRDPRLRPQTVRIARNFIHHNQKQEAGYGVEAHYGGFPLIEGNTFVSNRHAIMGDGRAYTSYRAWYNLVLDDAPKQHHLWYTQDFDMHGTGDNGFGGTGGQYMEIAGNTFLGTNRENLDLRGNPCFLAEFHDNISRRHLTPVSPFSPDPLFPAVTNRGDDNKLVLRNNLFGAGNPTDRLAVGDFDGDGLDDLFLATGQAWYYAPGANAEWRFLNAQTDTLNNLRFGDFDADGRTDVLAQHGRDWVVSWGGASKWERLNASDARITDFAVGDFVGDRRADVFYADGSQWYVSDGGVGPLTPINSSGFRLGDLRFGDFNRDRKTDVFSVVAGKWMVSFGAASPWTALRGKLTDNVSHLTVADFNGDGVADVATSDCSFLSDCDWKVSFSGTGNWTALRSAGTALGSAAAVGRFDGNASADVLLWHDNYLDIAASGSGSSHRQSRQDMR